MKTSGRKSAMATALVLAAALTVAAGPAADEPLPAPGKGDKCPVCGMFVAPYPEWTAAVVHRNGTAAFFDGAKDMFRYLLDMEKYGGGRRRSDVTAVYVTDYYTARLVDAREVPFVTGSRVLGPMGRELVPVNGEIELKEFIKDYGGSILKYDDIDSSNIP
jgi:nitrous oxide reductase accessory protein NosL